MRYLPINIDTQNKTILIVGGGQSAEAKLRTLIRSEANLNLVAPEITDTIQNWEREGRLSYKSGEWSRSDFEDVLLVYAATDDQKTNQEIARTAQNMGVFCNAIDLPKHCDFITPALVDRSPVTIAIGTAGTAPILARTIKADIEARLPQSLGGLALTIERLRKHLTRYIPEFSKRRQFWNDLFFGSSLSARLSTLPERFEREAQAILHDLEKQDSKRENPIGHVSLVGAGPGDPDLLTIAARQRLNQADVIIYDRLVSDDVLALAPREAEFIYVGKTPGQPSISQDKINMLLCDRAQKNLRVVRLKSGDPLIFGRADEEIEAIEKAGVSYDIVPGITAAASAAAELGVSLTRRGHNKVIAFMTGHDAQGFAEHDWKSLAAPGARAAIYMGSRAARFIQGRLLLHGADQYLPVTIVENASRADQKIVETNLGNLSQDIEAKKIKGPSILMLGFSRRDIRNIDKSDIKAAI